MVLAFVLLIVGFVLLAKGADVFVDGSSGIAKLLKIPSIVIGLTIAALGTSAPEAAVSIIAGVNGSNDIAVGNVIGSNMFNLLAVLGISALISPVRVDVEIVKKQFSFMLAATAVFALSAFDAALGGDYADEHQLAGLVRPADIDGGLRSGVHLLLHEKDDKPRRGRDSRGNVRGIYGVRCHTVILTRRGACGGEFRVWFLKGQISPI